jgi:1,2-phenylacetyl-CoA epoxidase PaaB subunit
MTQVRKWDVLLAGDDGEPVRFVGTYVAPDRKAACRLAANDVAHEARDPYGVDVRRHLIAYDSQHRSGWIVPTRLENWYKGDGSDIQYVGNGTGAAALTS